MFKRIGIAAVMLTGILVVVGCAKTEPSRAASDAELAEAREKDKIATESMAADAKSRDGYARDVRKQLDGLGKRYEELRIQARKAEGQAKTDLEKKIDQAKVKSDAACRKLDELSVTSSVRWQKVQGEMAIALAEVKRAVE